MFTNPASEFVYIRTYSRWLEEKKRREAWNETVTRYITFLKANRNDVPAKVWRKIEKYLLELSVMGSMRAIWAAGEAAQENNITMYNCSFLNVDCIEAFAECLYILCCGTGVGFKVDDDVLKLGFVPENITKNGQEYIIPDSKEGWADSVKILMKSLYSGIDISFDYSQIRKKGTRLKKMGGRASGPEPLAKLHAFIRDTLYNARGRFLTTLECHDIMNEIAEIVVVGGVRRSSEIGLSDLHDKLLRDAKKGNFPVRRFMANNSAIYYFKPDAISFLEEWASLASSGSGERGIFNHHAAILNCPKRREFSKLSGTNPCKSLKSLILTDNGYITFEQALFFDKLTILDDKGNKIQSSSPFLTKKNAPVTRITLSDGTYIYGTEDHLHKTVEGKWIPISELKIGDELKRPMTPCFNIEECDTNSEEYKKGLMIGWTWSDGWFFKQKNGNKITHGLCFGINEKDVANLFKDLFDLNIKPHQQKPDTCLVARVSSIGKLRKWIIDSGYDLDKSNLEWLRLQTKEFKLGFIKAAFTADGSVRKDNNVELYSIYESALQVLCSIFREFGIYGGVNVHGLAKSYIAKDGKVRNNKACYKLNIFAGQFKKIGFISKFKSDLLKEHTLKSIYRYKDYSPILEIERNFSIEDVYDITVDSQEHLFLDNGIITHNCGEIILRDQEFCNLSEVVVRADDDVDSLLDKVETATWLGCIQATFTNFPYLRPEWKKNCEEERLLGVSLTGQMDNPSLLTDEVKKALKAKAIKTAKHASKILGINMPAAITTSKPSGTVSQLVNCASGVHPRFSPYYIRRYRISSIDPLFKMIKAQGIKLVPENGQSNEDWLTKDVTKCPIYDGGEWSEDKVNTWVIEFPTKSPDGAICADQMSAIQQLEWYKSLVLNWSEHNNSMTVYVKHDEWFNVGNWVYNNWEHCIGISFLPYEEHNYKLAPYEKITKEQYEKMLAEFKQIDYTKLCEFESEDNTEGAKTLNCVADRCELK